MKKLIPLLTHVMLLTLVLAGCRGEEPKRMPDTVPDIRGYVSHIKKTNGKSDGSKALVLVKALDGIETSYREANIRIDKNTLIESKTGEEMKVEQLREGQEVEAWFEGDIMESMPVQGYVKALRVTVE